MLEFVIINFDNAEIINLESVSSDEVSFCVTFAESNLA